MFWHVHVGMKIGQTGGRKETCLVKTEQIGVLQVECECAVQKTIEENCSEF